MHDFVFSFKCELRGVYFFFFQAEDGIRDYKVTGVQTCALPISPVFAPGSRAEVSIVGRVDGPGGRPALVSGQIDRLVVTDSEVLIVDFKTNHAPPRQPAEAPRGYVRQLALYRAVLAKLYPQLLVRAALLWTETPELMEISAPALEAELASYHLGVT